MSKLVSMARTKAERKGEGKHTCCAPDAGKFPWGLELRFEKETLDKLGCKNGDFAVGEVVALSCKARVTGLNSSESEGREDSSVTLQIEALGLDSPESKRAEAVGKVYGRGK